MRIEEARGAGADGTLGARRGDAPRRPDRRGRGAARLRAADAADGALLLERLAPGQTLAEHARVLEDEAADIAVDVMHRLHATPPPFGLPSLATWTRGTDSLSSVPR